MKKVIVGLITALIMTLCIISLAQPTNEPPTTPNYGYGYIDMRSLGDVAQGYSSWLPVTGITPIEHEN